ncbi:hypothetical protein HD806DRAFT_525261 [Xylariaceae sp. AK1471]|nr:hypothetical protein HD806DRAFT_525261 [Xylariaceae sp. AK1471]
MRFIAVTLLGLGSKLTAYSENDYGSDVISEITGKFVNSDNTESNDSSNVNGCLDATDSRVINSYFLDFIDTNNNSAGNTYTPGKDQVLSGTRASSTQRLDAVVLANSNPRLSYTVAATAPVLAFLNRALALGGWEIFASYIHSVLVQLDGMREQDSRDCKSHASNILCNQF